MRVGADPEYFGIYELDRQLRTFECLPQQPFGHGCNRHGIGKGKAKAAQAQSRAQLAYMQS
jgi:hypothetical protein